MRGLLLIAGLLATPLPAWAKYDPCGHIAVLEPGGRVPRNAKIWLWRGGAERLRIRGPDLDRALAPPLTGSSRGLGAFDPGLLGRDERYRVVIVGDGYAWTLGELATGSELDLAPPRRPGFRALAITQRIDPREPAGSDDFDGFHGPASDLATALELSDDTIALDVGFDDSPEHFLVPRDDPGMLGRSRCGPGRSFRVGAHICMSIRAIDLAGNRSDPATRCTIVDGLLGDTSRAAYPYAWPARRPPPQDPPEGWLAIAVLAAGISGWLALRRVAMAHLLT